MRRFLSTWLALLVAAVFASAMLVCTPLLTKSAEQTARADLDALLDAAFAQFDVVGTDADAVAQVSESNVLAKARAVARFLAHDDALLQTDALVSLCELLGVSAIDVTDYEGIAVASSVAGRIGRDLTAESDTAWTKEVLDGESVERTRVDTLDKALLFGCVPRTDTEGFVLVQSLDAAILTAYASTDPALVLREFSFINDELAIASEPGEDGAYQDAERYYVRRTAAVSGDYGAISLVASRALGTVYVLRNAILLVLSVIGIISILCALVVQVLLLRRRRSRSRIAFDQKPLLPASLADADPISEAEAELLLAASDGAATEQPGSAPEEAAPDGQAQNPEPPIPETGTAEPEAMDGNARKRSKKRRQRGKIFELITIEPVEDAPIEAAPEEAASPEASAAEAAPFQDGSEASARSETEAGTTGMPEGRPAPANAQKKRPNTRAARRRAEADAQRTQEEDGFDKVF